MYNGVTRIVYRFGNYVIKLPNFTYSHLHFLQGCYCNYSERNYCKMFKNMPEYLGLVSPSIYCSIFGLVQIQRYCEPLKRALTDDEKDMFKDVCNDMKSENFGIYKNNIVCLDYA